MYVMASAVVGAAFSKMDMWQQVSPLCFYLNIAHPTVAIKGMLPLSVGILP